MKKRKARKRARREPVEVVVRVVHEHVTVPAPTRPEDDWDRPMVWDPFWNEFVPGPRK